MNRLYCVHVTCHQVAFSGQLRWKAWNVGVEPNLILSSLSALEILPGTIS